MRKYSTWILSGLAFTISLVYSIIDSQPKVVLSPQIIVITAAALGVAAALLNKGYLKIVRVAALLNLALGLGMFIDVIFYYNGGEYISPMQRLGDFRSYLATLFLISTFISAGTIAASVVSLSRLAFEKIFAKK